MRYVVPSKTVLRRITIYYGFDFDRNAAIRSYLTIWRGRRWTFFYHNFFVYPIDIFFRNCKIYSQHRTCQREMPFARSARVYNIIIRKKNGTSLFFSSYQTLTGNIYILYKA